MARRPHGARGCRMPPSCGGERSDSSLLPRCSQPQEGSKAGDDRRGPFLGEEARGGAHVSCPHLPAGPAAFAGCRAGGRQLQPEAREQEAGAGDLGRAEALPGYTANHRRLPDATAVCQGGRRAWHSPWAAEVRGYGPGGRRGLDGHPGSWQCVARGHRTGESRGSARDTGKSVPGYGTSRSTREP